MKALVSPAFIAALLLYGIVFLFAAAELAGVAWQRVFTSGFYILLVVVGGVAVAVRFRERRLIWNRIDALFILFMVSILLSAGLHWWPGTLDYLKLMPFLFLAPYVIGRVVDFEDGVQFRFVLVAMGVVLLILIAPYYFADLPYSDSAMPLLFGVNHGVMLSGLLLAAALVSLLSILLLPSQLSMPRQRRVRLLGFLLVILMTISLVWTGSRVGVLAAIVGGGIVLRLSLKQAGMPDKRVFLAIGLAAALAATHLLTSPYAARLYAQLASPLTILDFGASGDTLEGDAKEWRGPILGDKACESITNSVDERWVHYQQAIALVLNRPATGVGVNNYGFYACQRPGSFPHSTILQVFAELGVIVGVGYCLLIGLTLHAFLLAKKDANTGRQVSLWAWFFAFAVMQVLIAQITGNYFVSAALNFTMGVAASITRRNALLHVKRK